MYKLSVLYFLIVYLFYFLGIELLKAGFECSKAGAE